MARGTRDILAVFAAALLASAAVPGCARVGDDSRGGQLALEPPTAQSVGVCWVIHGDANRNATVGLMYRKKGAPVWDRARDLTRLEGGAPEAVSPLPGGSWVFTGSVSGLEEDTGYELRLALADPDGGKDVQVLRARTLKAPPPPGAGGVPPVP